MVTAALSDALSHPINVIRDLQSQHTSSSTSLPQVVESHFRNLFDSSNNLHKIPPLDVHHPPGSYPSGSLVRFRAMVQDTSGSPEIYVSHLGYGLDTLPPQANGVAPAHGQGEGETFNLRTLQDALNVGARGRERWRERTVFWSVSVPGESSWVGEVLDGKHPAAVEGTPSASTASMEHKFPLPDTPHIGALVKSYNTTEFKPSTVHDFVGILTFDPRLNTLGDESEDEEVLLPSLHVLFSTPLPATLVKAAYPMPPARGRSSAEVRQELVCWLAASALQGDELAAEYVLLCSIARVQSRSPFLPPPTLCLSHFPPSAASTLRQCLELLLPIVAEIPLSIKYLNEVPFAPSSALKDESEDLRSGALQLAPGTVVLVDEQGIGEGKLEDRGVRNIATMQSAMTAQTLAYAFPFSSYDFPTDLGFIVLTSGSNSPFFNTDIIVPLRPLSTPPPAPTPLSEEQLQEYRLWLAGAKHQAVSKSAVPIGQEMAGHIQSEFVRERKELGEKGLTSDDLSLRMSLTKLESYLCHEAEITKGAWDHVVRLERERKTRSSA